MLCGLLQPTGGKGFVGGNDITTESEEIKKHIGYMSQKFSLYDDLTVEENINFFSGIYKVSREKKRGRMEWVLEMSGLKDHRNSITKTLSGGFKQRLALGCAILHEPSILFLDEPTSGVDPISRRNFWDLIYETARKGTTVFVTTHYMDEADYCDRLALIYRGRVIAEGTPGEMRRKYMKRDVLEIEVDRLLAALEAVYKNGIESAIFGSLLHATVDNAAQDIPRIEELLKKEGIAVKRIEKIMPSLEDVFVTLIEVA
jgi:ABC-2 type transport system ATP-binding protein